MKIRKGSVNEFALLALEKAVDGLLELNHFVYNPHLYIYGGSEYPRKKIISAAIRRMRERGLVEFEEDKRNQIVVKLTNLGKDALGDLSASENKWDGEWRLVIFDVPELKRGVRDLFRRRLKDWGFKSWQKSVWIGKRNVADKLRQLIVKLEIDDCVAVIESADPNLDTLLKRSWH